MEYANLILLRALFLNNLMQIAHSYGISFPLFIKATKQVSKLIGGTAVSELTANGLTRNIFIQSFLDTRLLHLWVISSNCPTDFMTRLFYYVALESTGIKFGHLNGGAVAILGGGYRNMIANGLSSEILYNSTQVIKVLDIEKNAIKIAALIGKKGRKILPIVLGIVGGGQEQYASESIIVKPILDTRTITFHNNCKIIFQNIVEEHTARRALNGSVTKSTVNKILVSTFSSTAAKSTSTNLIPFICWTTFGLAFTVSFIILSLSLFQHADVKRLQNQNNETIIDIDHFIR